MGRVFWIDGGSVELLPAGGTLSLTADAGSDGATWTAAEGAGVRAGVSPILVFIDCEGCVSWVDIGLWEEHLELNLRARCIL